MLSATWLPSESHTGARAIGQRHWGVANISDKQETLLQYFFLALLLILFPGFLLFLFKQPLEHLRSQIFCTLLVHVVLATVRLSKVLLASRLKSPKIRRRSIRIVCNPGPDSPC